MIFWSKITEYMARKNILDPFMETFPVTHGYVSGYVFSSVRFLLNPLARHLASIRYMTVGFESMIVGFAFASVDVKNNPITKWYFNYTCRFNFYSFHKYLVRRLSESCDTNCMNRLKLLILTINSELLNSKHCFC